MPGGSTPLAYDYDSENRQVRYRRGQAVEAEYAYDGDGRRVRKVAGAATTAFVYDAMGRLVAEYTNAAQPASTGGVNYLTQDQLGGTRVVTGKDGRVESRHDYLPFGEEVRPGAAAGGGRAGAQGYEVGGVRQKFTGYEKDSETGLDFAQARYYENSPGRFTSIDPLLSSARPATPQSWNRYTYVLNNPLILTDPSGMDWAMRHTGEGENRKVEFLFYTGALTEAQLSEQWKPYTQNWYFAASGAVYLGHRGANDYVFIPRQVFDEAAIGAPGYDNIKGATPGSFNDYEKEVLGAALFYVKPSITGQGDLAKDIFTAFALSVASGSGPATKPAAAGDALVTASDDIIVIGNLHHVRNYQGMQGTFVYTVPKRSFSLTGNDAMIAEGMANRQTFQLATPPTNKFLFDAAGRETVFGREFGQIRGGGYTCFGCYLVPPPPKF